MQQSPSSEVNNFLAIKIFPKFYRTRMFINMLTRACISKPNSILLPYMPIPAKLSPSFRFPMKLSLHTFVFFPCMPHSQPILSFISSLFPKCLALNGYNISFTEIMPVCEQYLVLVTLFTKWVE